MKASEYLKRWREKRGEWRIDDNADADWGQMSSLLDEHMPVKDDDDPAAGRRFRLLPIMFISISAAAMVFVTSKVVRHERAATKKSHKHYRSAPLDKKMADSSKIQYNDVDSSGFPGDSTSMDQKNNMKAVDSVRNAPVGQLTESVTAAGAHTKSSAVIPNNNERGNKPGNSGKENHLDNKNTSGLLAGTRNMETSSINTGSNNRSHNVQSFTDKTRVQLQAQKNYYPDKSTLLLGEPFQSLNFNMPQATTLFIGYPHSNLVLAPLDKSKIKNGPSSPASKSKSAGNSPLEWGLLIGVNSPGSFTPKNQNANFYGSLGIDPFAGAYATYHFGDKWGAGLQLRVLSPSTITGNYQIPHKIQTDSINTTTYRAQPDSRKLYSVQVPVYATYQLSNFAALKAGPVLSFPIKQLSTAKTDSASAQLLTSSRYDQKFDLGLTGGVILRYKRLSFDIAYLRGFTTHTVKSDSLSYKMHNSQLQFTIGIQLGGKKH